MLAEALKNVCRYLLFLGSERFPAGADEENRKAIARRAQQFVFLVPDKPLEPLKHEPDLREGFEACMKSLIDFPARDPGILYYRATEANTDGELRTTGLQRVLWPDEQKSKVLYCHLETNHGGMGKTQQFLTASYYFDGGWIAL